MSRMVRFLVLAVLALAIAPPAHPVAADDTPKQKFCPIMTTDEIDPENAYTVDYKGVKVLLCCDACRAKFRRRFRRTSSSKRGGRSAQPRCC